MQDVHSIPQVCEIWTVSGPEADDDAVADVFCDLPHGATRLGHLAHAKTLTAVYLDDRYDKLFLANTVQGAPEYALCFARMICDPDGLEALPGLSARAREQVRARVAAMKVVLIPLPDSAHHRRCQSSLGSGSRLPARQPHRRASPIRHRPGRGRGAARAL